MIIFCLAYPNKRPLLMMRDLGDDKFVALNGIDQVVRNNGSRLGFSWSREELIAVRGAFAAHASCWRFMWEIFTMS